MFYENFTGFPTKGPTILYSNFHNEQELSDPSNRVQSQVTIAFDNSYGTLEAR